MEWYHILAMILGNAGFIIPLFLWNRAESRADYRHIEASTSAQIASVNAQIAAIHAEMKDFHGRLCAIEERRNK